LVLFAYEVFRQTFLTIFFCRHFFTLSS